MKVLIVANRNRGQFAPFVAEQAQALAVEGIEVTWFGVIGHGITGYLRNLPRLIQTIRREHPDLVHAHYGLCGLLACLQRRVPVVTTYHGSDINTPRIRRLCRLALRRSKCNIFVSEPLKALAGDSFNPCVIPCGVDLDAFPPVGRDEARRQLGLDPARHYVLFASAFDNSVKNAPLAQRAMQQVPQAELLELKGYTRQEVALLLRAVDCLLMTSTHEGSPQVVKEALACGTPIVSVPVGDVPRLIEQVEGCHIAHPDPDDIAAKLLQAIAFEGYTQGRDRITLLGLNNKLIAQHLTTIYAKITRSKRSMLPR